MENNLNFANMIVGSDCFPFEVVRRVSEKIVDVRSMAYQLDPTWKPVMHPGGFAAHCSNQQEQRWIITPAPDRAVVRLRLHKDGRWRSAGGNRYTLSATPRRFHDYNF